MFDKVVEKNGSKTMRFSTLSCYSDHLWTGNLSWRRHRISICFHTLPPIFLSLQLFLLLLLKTPDSRKAVGRESTQRLSPASLHGFVRIGSGPFPLISRRQSRHAPAEDAPMRPSREALASVTLAAPAIHSKPQCSLQIDARI